MKKILLIVIFLISGTANTQTIDSSVSFIEELRNIIELRKGFSVSSESTSPALFSYSKKNDDSAVYTIDAAILIKVFKYQDFSITPFVQFDYTSNGKDRKEKIKSGITAKYLLYSNKIRNNGKVSFILK